MKTRLKLGITTLALLLYSLVFHYGSLLLNIPSDVAFGGGILVMILLIIFGPTGLWLIWRKKSNDTQEKPVA